MNFIVLICDKEDNTIGSAEFDTLSDAAIVAGTFNQLLYHVDIAERKSAMVIASYRNGRIIEDVFHSEIMGR